MNVFDDVQTILFCDESKFSIKDGNAEDAIYYFGVAMPIKFKNQLQLDFSLLLEQSALQTPVFHSTVIFKERRPRLALMSAICDLIIKYRLHCFCFKYYKPDLFEATKYLNYLNDGDSVNFNNPEFQAVFYFITLLNTHLRDDKPKLLSPKLMLFFERNLYGRNETEDFNFKDDSMLIKHMTFVDKEKILLLALPDFLGYIFRKAKISFNKSQRGDLSLETSKLVINSYCSLLRISEAGLFHFLGIDTWLDSIN
jgi:hypothetical protein